MVERLSVWVTRGRSSVTVDAGGVVREVAGPDTGAMLRAMARADRAVLRAFCLAVVDATAGDDRSLEGGR